MTDISMFELVKVNACSGCYFYEECTPCPKDGDSGLSCVTAGKATGESFVFKIKVDNTLEDEGEEE